MRFRLWCVLSLLMLLIAWPNGNLIPAFADGPALVTPETLEPDAPFAAADADSDADAVPSCVPSFSTIPPDSLDNEQEIAESISVERVRRGLAPLTLNAELTKASRLHSRDMVDNNNLSHYGSDGSNPNQRITRSCYQGAPWGEIIVWGYGHVSDVIGWWMNSPVHRGMILNPRFRDYGVGYAYNPDSYYKFGWTVTFGAEY